MSRERSKKRRSCRHAKERRRLARLARRTATRRKDDHRHFAKRQVSAHTLAGVEDLLVRNMMGSVRGTAKRPGVGVSRRRGLNRSTHRAAWSLFLLCLTSACVTAGTFFKETFAAGASTTCFESGYSNRQYRESRSESVCLACGGLSTGLRSRTTGRVAPKTGIRFARLTPERQEKVNRLVLYMGPRRCPICGSRVGGSDSANCVDLEAIRPTPGETAKMR